MVLQEPIEGPSPAPLDDLPGEAPPQSSSASEPVSSEAVAVPQALLAPREEASFEWLRRLILEAPQQSSSSASMPESSVTDEVPQPVFVPPEEAPFEFFFVPPEEAPLLPLSAADLGAVYAEGAVPVFASPKKSSGGAPIKRAGEDAYEVASIGSHRWVPHGRGKMLEYCVGWRGHDEPSWEKASQFVHAQSILKKYRAANNLL
ncbi:hypothetical protein AAVH_23343 [Aphelenchoides avenae]|nr:hypothetical protein AAVH_23343 [Aphelenchus avenae]